MLCWRAGKMREWGQATCAAVAAWLVVNLPIALLYPSGWYEFFRLNSARGADPDSIYNVITSFTGWGGFDGTLYPGDKPLVLNAVTLGLFAIVCVAIAYIAVNAPMRPRLAQLCFLVVAGFLLTNKVWSPQYSLWLVPLAVLALPHRRLLLAWMTVDALIWFPRMYYYLGIGNKGVPEQWFTAAIVLRDIAVIGLCALVVRQIYRPQEDLIRRNGTDDPIGGVLDHTRDVHRVSTGTPASRGGGSGSGLGPIS